MNTRLLALLTLALLCASGCHRDPRMDIYIEALNAEKRALRTGEREIVPRPSDLHAVIASTAGKLELEYGGEETIDAVVERLLRRAIVGVWDVHLEGQVDEVPHLDHLGDHQHRAALADVEQSAADLVAGGLDLDRHPPA